MVDREHNLGIVGDDGEEGYVEEHAGTRAEMLKIDEDAARKASILNEQRVPSEESPEPQTYGADPEDPRGR